VGDTDDFGRGKLSPGDPTNIVEVITFIHKARVQLRELQEHVDNLENALFGSYDLKPGGARVVVEGIAQHVASFIEKSEESDRTKDARDRKILGGVRWVAGGLLALSGSIVSGVVVELLKRH
jgi:hypothetical protein